MAETFTPKIYLMRACPYCLKLNIFLTEAGISDRFSLIVFEGGDDTHQAVRSRMLDAGQKPSFPAAELEDGTLVTGTDDLISRFAEEADLDSGTMPLLYYYSEGVFKKHLAMYRELQELKEASAQS